MGKVYTVQGVSGNIQQISALFKLPEHTVRKRLREGESIDNAVSPVRRVVFLRTGSCSGFYTWEKEDG